MTEEAHNTTAAVRPFESYTAADHARVAMAAAAWSVMTAAYEALVPELRREAPPAVLIDAARSVDRLADQLLRAAVIAGHEQGLTWTQIGGALDVTKQSAHERFADQVTGFRRDLVNYLAALRDDPDAQLPGGSSVCDTSWYARRIDAWRAELGEMPGAMTVAGQPGELLARLSDPSTAITHVNGISARPADAPAPRCRFTAEAQ